jgi:hypothetical protein
MDHLWTSTSQNTDNGSKDSVPILPFGLESTLARRQPWFESFNCAGAAENRERSTSFSPRRSSAALPDPPQPFRGHLRPETVPAGYPQPDFCRAERAFSGRSCPLEICPSADVSGLKESPRWGAAELCQNSRFELNSGHPPHISKHEKKLSSNDRVG